MLPYWLIGILSGLGAAVLNFAALSGSSIGLLMVLVTPLPIFIAGLGWGNFSGLIAAAVSGLSVAFATEPLAGFLFFIATSLPAFWLSNLAVLSRKTTNESRSNYGQDEWYPIGRIVVWAAGIAAALALAVLLIVFAFDEAKIAETIDQLVEQIFTTGAVESPETALSKEQLSAMMLVLLPASFTLFSLYALLANLYMGAKVVQMSGRLNRPWPDLTQFQLPNWFGILFAITFALTLILDGMAGRIFQIISVALGGSFLLLGLAVLHAITRGRSARTLILSGIYLFLFLFGWIGLPIMILGAAESSLKLRDRYAGRTTTPPDSD